MILLLLLPLFLVLSAVRLYQLPIQLKEGTIRFKRGSGIRLLISTLVIAAYFALLLSTFVVMLVVPASFFVKAEHSAGGVPVLLIGASFPVLYLIAELFIYWGTEKITKPKTTASLDSSLFKTAAAKAVAQFYSGGTPYVTCPSCKDTLTVEVARSGTNLGSINVRCRCGSSNATRPI